MICKGDLVLDSIYDTKIFLNLFNVNPLDTFFSNYF